MNFQNYKSIYIYNMAKKTPTRRKSARKKRRKSRGRMSGGGKLGPWLRGKEFDEIFKNKEKLPKDHIWRMQVDPEATGVTVGFTNQHFDVNSAADTDQSCAWFDLDDGTTSIYSEISEDGNSNYHPGHLKKDIPTTVNALALRVNNNMPQIQFNNVGKWHDFGNSLITTEWYPSMVRKRAKYLTKHRVDLQRPPKSASKTFKNPGAEAGAGEGAEAEVDRLKSKALPESEANRLAACEARLAACEAERDALASKLSSAEAGAAEGASTHRESADKAGAGAGAGKTSSSH